MKAPQVRSRLMLAVGLMPAGRVKNRALNLLGNDVARTATVKPSLLARVERLVMDDGAVLGFGNCLRDLTRVELGRDAKIGQWNWISAAVPFRATDPEWSTVGVLVVEKHAAMTSRHYVDASGGVRIEQFATVAGVRSTFITHGIDVSTSEQTAQGIVVGAHSLVGSNCKVVPGAVVPARSVIGMGATITRSLRGEAMLHAGTPARPINSVGDAAYFDRTRGTIMAVRLRR